MAAASTRVEFPPNSSPRHQGLTRRELRATRAADRQGLSLRPIPHSDPSRYELVCGRNNRPVATGLKLEIVESWVGIQPTTRR